MKKHSKTIQILIFLIVFYFILQPFFSNPSEISFETWTFPWQQIITGMGFLFFYIFYIRDSQNKKNENFSPKQKILLSSFTTIFTLALLFFNSLVFKFLAIVLPALSRDVSVCKPDSFYSFIFCLLNFTFSACYEEILYRAYITDSLISIFNIEKIEGKKKIIFTVIFEFSGTLLFAFAHIYAGVLSVINAVIAHLILRFIYIKTGNIYTNITAHCLYNLLILFVF